jgi:hypothetical protein
MSVHAGIQRAADPSHFLKPQFNAQAGASNKAGRVPVAARGISNGADEMDSSIYDFNTHAEGEEAVSLLIRNGFNGIDLRLVGGPFWGRLSDFVFGSARKMRPHTLMMHGNAIEASKAHSVLVQHTNGLIEECLRFR